MSASASDDPTATTSLRNRKESKMNGLWREVRGVITETVQTNDAFRLIDGRTHLGMTFDGSRMTYSGRPVQDFGAEQHADRMSAWAAWFPTVTDSIVLQPLPPAEVQRGRHYTGNMVREAYARGLALAGSDARQVGLVSAENLSDPSGVIGDDIHQDGLGAQYRAIYSDLERVVSETETDVERTVDSNLPKAAAGALSVSEFTSRVNTRVDKTGASGSRRVVASRIVDTVNEGIIRRADDLGAREIGVRVEGGQTDEAVQWQTAGDDDVCEQCASLEGQTYTVAEVRQGFAPRPVRDTHPNCRCRLVILS